MTLLEPHPYIYQSGIFSVYTHGLFFALGGIVSAIVLAQLAKKHSLNSERAIEWVCWSFILGLIGARLGFFLIYPSAYISIGQVLSIWQGGLVSFFGMLTGGLTFWWQIRKHDPQKSLIWLDLFSLSALIGWGIGRIGNYYAADVVGVQSDYWTLFYGRVPIQLFESLACFVLVAWGIRILRMKKLTAGKLAYILLIGYLLLRFFIDGFRDEGQLGILRISQWTELTLIIFFLPISLYFQESK